MRRRGEGWATVRLGRRSALSERVAEVKGAGWRLGRKQAGARGRRWVGAHLLERELRDERREAAETSSCLTARTVPTCRRT